MVLNVYMDINPAALREIRRIRGFSISALAKAAGTKQPHLSNIEKNRRGASDELIVRLADVLDVHPDALLAVSEAHLRANRARTAA